MALNPYVSGPVVREADKFVGRRAIVQKIIRELGNNVVFVYGQRRVGKSSILFRVESELWSDEDGFMPVYFSLEGQLDQSIETLLGAIANTINGVCELKETEQIQDSISLDKLKSVWLPVAIKEIKHKGHRGIVLLLDEFDAISDYIETKNADQFYFALRDLRATNTQIKLVAVTGRHPGTLIESAKSLFAHSVKIHIPLMSYEEIEELTRLSGNFFIWTTEATEVIWALTKGHPLLAQSLCSRIWKKFPGYISINEKPIVTEDAVNNALSVLTNEFGHVVDYAWLQLNAQEQFTICYLATFPEATNALDLLNYLEMQALSDYFRSPDLIHILSGLETNDWVEKGESGYYIKIPIYRNRIRQTRELSSLQDILFDDRARAFSLSTQASKAKDDLAAIKYLRQSLAIYPDDERTRALLAKKYHTVIEFYLSKDENNLALKHIRDLSQYEKKSEAIQVFERRAQINIKVDITKQKIELFTGKEDYLEAYQLVDELKKYKPKLSRKTYFNVLFSHFQHIALYTVLVLILASPGLITLLLIRQFTEVGQPQIYNFILITFAVFVAVLGSSIRSILNVNIKEILQNSSFESVFINAVALYILVYGIPDMILSYKVGLVILILISMSFTVIPFYELSFKASCALLIDVVVTLMSLLLSASNTME